MIIFPLKDGINPKNVLQSITLRESKNGDLSLSFQITDRIFKFAFTPKGKEKRLISQN